jgi:radical SAM/Cys-rich protein
MTAATLHHRGSPLADTTVQLEILDQRGPCDAAAFADRLAKAGLPPLHADAISTLQVNLGKLCNQTCRHCHVDAGPDRREVMARETLELCLAAARSADIRTIDITGGAPEMNPHFEWFVTELRRDARHVIDRCNLTILSAPGFAHLPEFLAQHEVEVIASLPCYLEENCDRQRGDGVFRRSIDGLRRLNALGYGSPGSGLELSLVYNPVGPSLPPDQSRLESDYRRRLRDDHQVEFTRLYTITNLPISRFLDDLLSSGRYESYMEKLVGAFNPDAVAGLMCRTTLSVDWRGYLFDCDFNQMLNLPVAERHPRHLREFAAERLNGRPIVTRAHCFGCTAGAGSSCGGAIVAGK